MATARKTKTAGKKSTNHADVEALRRARDELKLQMKLAQADLRDEWKRLEGTWQKVRVELDRTGRHSKESVAGMNKAGKELLAELKRGYKRIKSQLGRSATR